ncbi:hypothetical protein [Pseudomonas aeruginosa]|uniref:hypothetical protein n=1 Tax=Pseudomonas aeruginosa TaxID=287 RepID=UPI001495AA46|nr:hypothetical protein [Pseudomonas aeruginosa]EKU2925430.1 hypothetical protein [Pseudomonas aeruginosa]MCU9229600.1 hypothetical protein [Pseudomonas aeruginosa]MDF5940615.1 hypothetical protein [Pseudomonas aeruginosa]HCF4724538.1 hypothetical protein [Pseudomonas aeruginosa]HCF4755773.1 hypothetical protein [Pseudomonas aeruginosa]
MQLRAAASGLLLALLAGQTVAASFDCSKASSFPEKEICRDGYLSGLDDWLAKSYRTALEVNPDQYEAVRQSQREWLATRDACTDQKCLDKTIGARIQALDQYVTAERGKSASALAQAQLIKRQEEEAIRQRQTEERLATEEAARQTQIENQRQQAIIELQQRAQAAQAIESQRAIEHQQALAQIPQYQPAQQVAQASSATSFSPSYRAPEKSLWQQFKSSPAWKYMLLAGALLTAWAMWRHHQGQATIYNDYTDAAITNLLPAAGVVLAFLMNWLELPRQLAMVAGLTGFMLALMFAVYASVRTNQGWLSISLSLIAKMTLVSVFYAVLGALVASLFVSTKYKGESQARANARNRREKKETMAMIAALTTAYTFLSAWLCRRQEFIPVSECLAFDSTASVA